MTITGGAFNAMQSHILEEQEKRQEYEKARTNMIAGISHDLRTPLTAISGSIKGVLDGVASTPEMRDHFLRTAYQRTGEIDQMLGQLLDLSRLETGNVPLTMKNVDMVSFIRAYAERRKEDLKVGEESLSADTDLVKSAVVCIDPDQMRRVFDNLISNSRKYGDVKPLCMKLRLEDFPRTVRICFYDNGKGVPNDKLPHLFEEFYRVDESRHQKEGSGLGLYIVEYLIRAMGGKVWAENKGGLSIFMELPKCEAEGNVRENERMGKMRNDKKGS